MPPLEELNGYKTVVANMLVHHMLPMYDPETKTLSAMAYPGIKTPKGRLVPVPLHKLKAHMALHTNVQLGSCICGPLCRQPQQYTPLHLIRCGPGSLPTNIGKYALICSNGPQAGCGWWGPLTLMMQNCSSHPNYIMHSVHNNDWPSSLGDLEEYVPGNGPTMSPLWMEYQLTESPFPFADDDYDDAPESPTKLPQSLTKRRGPTKQPLCSSQLTTPIQSVRFSAGQSLTTPPFNRSLSTPFAAPTPLMSMATPRSASHPPTPAVHNHIHESLLTPKSQVLSPMMATILTTLNDMSRMSTPTKRPHKDDSPVPDFQSHKLSFTQAWNPTQSSPSTPTPVKKARLMANTTPTHKPEHWQTISHLTSLR